MSNYKLVLLFAGMQVIACMGMFVCVLAIFMLTHGFPQGYILGIFP